MNGLLEPHSNVLVLSLEWEKATTRLKVAGTLVNIHSYIGVNDFTLLMKFILVFVIATFSTEYLSTQICFCSWAKASLPAVQVWWLGHSHLAVHDLSIRVWQKLTWSVAVFSTTVCLLWQRPLVSSSSTKDVYHEIAYKLVFCTIFVFEVAKQQKCTVYTFADEEKIVLYDPSTQH